MVTTRKESVAGIIGLSVVVFAAIVSAGVKAYSQPTFGSLSLAVVAALFAIVFVAAARVAVQRR
jgi:uncharacterized membrane protein